MVKKNIFTDAILRLLKKDLSGKKLKQRNGRLLLKFLSKVYKVKKLHNVRLSKRNWNFFRILNIPRPIYRRRKTKYGKYFILRQQFRIFYGFLRVKTIRYIIKKSFKKFNALNFFLYLMESRLDVILYRLNIVSSIRAARQLVVHGTVQVNNKIIRNPNYNLKMKDILTFNKQDTLKYKKQVLNNIKSRNFSTTYLPNYIESNLDIFLFKFIKFNFYDIPFFCEINPYTFLSIMNFYTKYYF